MLRSHTTAICNRRGSAWSCSCSPDAARPRPATVRRRQCGINRARPSASFGQDTSGSAASTPGTATTVQYLAKTLNIDMTVTDTRKSADEIQTWVTATDPKSTSAGSSYEDLGDKPIVSR